MPERDHVDARLAPLGDLALELGEEVRRQLLDALRRPDHRRSSPATNSAENVAVADVLDGAGEAHGEVVGHLDDEVAAVGVHRHGALARARDDRGDGGGARPRSRRERLPRSALPDPHPDLVPGDRPVELDVRPVREPARGARSGAPTAGRSSRSTAALLDDAVRVSEVDERVGRRRRRAAVGPVVRALERRRAGVDRHRRRRPPSPRSGPSGVTSSSSRAARRGRRCGPRRSASRSPRTRRRSRRGSGSARAGRRRPGCRPIRRPGRDGRCARPGPASARPVRRPPR